MCKKMNKESTMVRFVVDEQLESKLNYSTKRDDNGKHRKGTVVSELFSRRYVKPHHNVRAVTTIAYRSAS